MRRLFALYINEMIKIIRKVNVIIILSLMVVGIIGTGLLVYTQKSSFIRSFSNNDGSFSSKDELNMNNERLNSINKQISSAKDAELTSLQQEKTSIEDRNKQLQYAIDNGFNLNSSSYRAELCSSMFAIQDEIKAATTETDKARLTTEFNKIETLLKNKDFKGYIQYKKDTDIASKLSSDIIKINNEIYDLKLKYNIDGESKNSSYFSNLVSQIESDKMSLLYGVQSNDTTQAPLTAESRQKIVDNITLNEYRLDKNVSEQNQDDQVRDLAVTLMNSVGLFAIVILLMILAGSAISSEISTGSIKSLIISPTKRWKIFTAKGLSLLTMGLSSLLLLYLISMVVSSLLFGFSNGSSYIFVTNGTAHELDFYLYKFAYLLAAFIGVTVISTFAFMLSTITRNTAASVAISLALYFIGSTATAVISQYFKGEWLKFIPFNNLNFETTLFPNDSLLTSAGASGSINPLHITVTFSVCYVAVAMFLMLYTALDSFNRRDIK